MIAKSLYRPGSKGFNDIHKVFCTGLLMEDKGATEDGTLVAISVAGVKNMLLRPDKSTYRYGQSFEEHLSYHSTAIPRGSKPSIYPSRAEFFVAAKVEAEMQIRQRPVLDSRGIQTGMIEVVFRDAACDARRASSESGNFYIVGSDLAEVRQKFWAFFKTVQAPAPKLWEEQVWDLMMKEKMITPLVGFNMCGVKVTFTEAQVRDLVAKHWIKSLKAIESGTPFNGMFGEEILLKGRDLRDRLEQAKQNKGATP